MKTFARLATISLFAASSIYAADTLEDAFKGGTTTGELSVYTVSTDNKTIKDSGYTVGSMYLNYATAELNGFKATFGGRANHLFNEKETDDYWTTDDGKWGDSTDTSHTKAVVTEANISYANDMVTIIAGRQPIDLEWIGDYHDAVVGILAYDKLTAIAGYTKRKMAADPDGRLQKMGDILDKDGKKTGAAVVDLSYAINDNLSVGAYYMDAQDLFSAVGGSVTGSLDALTATAKYAQTSEDDSSVKDGDIVALDLSYAIGEIATIGGGYIKADKEGGTGTIAALGDNISPFEDGNQVYGTDAKTWYLNASTEVAGFGLGALYGETKYLNGTTKEKEKELNLFVDKEVYKNLTASVIYADVKTHDKDDKYNYASLQLTYSF
ncbi:MAG: Opr family porin [Arcobacteraceae bacterium]|jgi:hypothetical protein|nr:Opr family porin [Arcobacteraceae bacterium]